MMRPMSRLDDEHMLPRDLESIYEWAEQNNMSFNNSKFKVLHYEGHGEIPNHRTYTSPGRDQIRKHSKAEELGNNYVTD